VTTDRESVVERLLNESPKLSMREAGRLFGILGEIPIHSATVSRWALRGVVLPNKKRLKLEHFRCGGRLLTTRPAVVRFLEAQNESPDEIELPKTPAQKKRKADRTAKELEELGIN
jgi:hypothetical protein